MVFSRTDTAFGGRNNSTPLEPNLQNVFHLFRHIGSSKEISMIHVDNCIFNISFLDLFFGTSQIEPLAGWGVNSGRPTGSLRSIPIPPLIDQRQWGKIVDAGQLKMLQKMNEKLAS